MIAFLSLATLTECGGPVVSGQRGRDRKPEGHATPKEQPPRKLSGTETASVCTSLKSGARRLPPMV
jgi:hypothetical protein